MGNADAAERVEAIAESSVHAGVENDAAAFAARISDADVVGEIRRGEEDQRDACALGTTRLEPEELDAAHAPDAREVVHFDGRLPAAVGRRRSDRRRPPRPSRRERGKDEERRDERGREEGAAHAPQRVEAERARGMGTA